MRLVHRAIIAVVVALAATTFPAVAQSQSRVALVIGNSAYRNVPALPNPVNDASDVAGALQRLGFSVTKVADGGFDEMRRALIAFGRQAANADMAAVFFAGHGMEVAGENWLIPVDAELKSDTDAENEAVSLRSVMLQVANARELGLIVLDACRNNPFAAKMQRSLRVRAVENGLSRVEPSGNVLVAYAARDGTTAQDGSGRNSPFTAALLRNLETPGLEITFVFRNVRDDVLEATRNEQMPFVYGSLSRKAIYLAKPAAEDQAQSDEAARVWPGVRDTTSAAVLEDFIRRFSSTVYGGMARARLDELRRTAAAPVAQAVEPRLVGMWELMVPNNRGVARWLWHIQASGAYDFHAEGPGAAPAHEGQIAAGNGRWRLHASKGLVWDDGGAYEFRENAVVMSGRLGTGIWRRIEAAGR